MGHKVSGPIVLVIDDEAGVRDVFCRMLASGGFHPITADSAERALSLLQGGLVPSAILLDLRMPGMGGLGFLLQLRADARFAGLPVALVTGAAFIDHATQHAVETLGASIHYKPVNVDDVVLLATRMVAAESQRPSQGF